LLLEDLAFVIRGLNTFASATPSKLSRHIAIYQLCHSLKSRTNPCKTCIYAIPWVPPSFSNSRAALRKTRRASTWLSRRASTWLSRRACLPSSGRLRFD